MSASLKIAPQREKSMLVVNSSEIFFGAVVPAHLVLLGRLLALLRLRADVLLLPALLLVLALPDLVLRLLHATGLILHCDRLSASCGQEKCPHLLGTGIVLGCHKGGSRMRGLRALLQQSLAFAPLIRFPVILNESQAAPNGELCVADGKGLKLCGVPMAVPIGIAKLNDAGRKTLKATENLLNDLSFGTIRIYIADRDLEQLRSLFR